MSVKETQNSNKYILYSQIIKSLPYDLYEITYIDILTFQIFKKGTTFPIDPSLKISRESFQKAFLLNWILGKGDAHAGNTLYHADTGEIFEVDNEWIGQEDYDPSGILWQLPKELEQEIHEKILDELQSVSCMHLQTIRSKYISRDKQLLEIWTKSKGASALVACEQAIAKKWEGIIQRFNQIKQSIQTLRSSSAVITIESLRKSCDLPVYPPVP